MARQGEALGINTVLLINRRNGMSKIVETTIMLAFMAFMTCAVKANVVLM